MKQLEREEYQDNYYHLRNKKRNIEAQLFKDTCTVKRFWKKILVQIKDKIGCKVLINRKFNNKRSRILQKNLSSMGISQHQKLYFIRGM